MRTKNETSRLMHGGRDEDDGIYETYNHAAGNKDNDVYETPYSDDQYAKPYEGHTYAEYEKPKNKTETNKKKILLIVAIVLLIMGLATGIGSYFIMNNEDSETEELSEGLAKNCEFNRNDECLDDICSEQCSQCKNYRRMKTVDEQFNDTCVPPKYRECVLDGRCEAEIRSGYNDNFGCFACSMLHII